MAAIYNEIREKRNILRDLYGGMMTLSDLSRELGMKPEDAKVWAMEQGLCIQLGKRLKVEIFPAFTNGHPEEQPIFTEGINRRMFLFIPGLTEMRFLII